ncbi:MULTISPECIES: flavodoxin family protein [unclassified Roseovarius]|uniref:flavodoxin family protein n=1 Tax=unclassified Roseovarius TaxID=2614913 RepID=UPI00273E66E0|nr:MULTISPECIES: flavodoxin family protein [unclassified Roseovarius]
MTRVACLLGSPRAGGNSDLLAGAFCDAAGEAGASVEQFALRDLLFQGCVSLRHCKTGGETCGLGDDLNPVLSAVAEADVVVIATPIYFCNMSGLAKQALDRFFSFFVPDYVTADVPSRLGRNKTFVLVQVQGEGADRYGDLLDQYGPALDKLGFQRRELIRASGVREIGDVLARSDALQQAKTLARDLTGGGV